MDDTSEECENKYAQLFSATADSKEKVKESNKHQLVANMNKCAGDIAISAINNGLSFNKITVLGILVDYESDEITKVYKLEQDYCRVKSTLYKCEDASISITDGFSRVISVLSNALVNKSTDFAM